tara:strand:- start:559 stop:1329 length:771 start_codon:yes stop_codon:yes gene_type:complete
MNRLANVPQNNYNIWNLVAQGLIGDEDVLSDGKIADQEYLNYLGSLNLNNIGISTNSSSRPLTARNPIRRAESMNSSSTNRPNTARNPIRRAESTNRPNTASNNSRIPIRRAEPTNRPNRDANTPRNLIRRVLTPTIRPTPPDIPFPNRNRPSIYRNSQENTRIDSNFVSNNNRIIKTPGARPIDISLNNSLPKGKENEVCKNDFTCVICLTNKRSHLITPCNHFCLCQNCAFRIRNQNKCPICRKLNIKVQKVFF